MNIFDTTLGGDVATIINANGSSTSSMNITMEWLLAGFSNLPVKKVHSLNTMRDYREGSFDVITAVVDITVTDYQTIVYPGKTILHMIVTKTPASAKGSTSASVPSSITYKALLTTKEDFELFDQGIAGTNEKEKDSNTMQIAVQLIESVIYQCKNTERSTVFGTGSLEDYLYALMSNMGSHPCSIHPVDNIEDTDNIVIRDGIPLIDLANYIQRDGPGIYDHGINTYFQSGMMYVYPVALLKTHEYRRKVSIYRSGNDVGIGSANTFAWIGSGLSIISSGDIPPPTGKTRLDDQRDALEQSHGNSIRWNDPRLQSNIVEEENGTSRYTSKGAHVFGLSDVNIKIQKTHKSLTVNGYSQRSIINKTVGRVIVIPWQNGNVDLIDPGTEVAYYYMKGKGMECVTGFVEGTMEILTPMEGNGNSSLFSITAVLRIRIP